MQKLYILWVKFSDILRLLVFISFNYKGNKGTVSFIATKGTLVWDVMLYTNETW